jgi:hypothetical protein
VAHLLRVVALLLLSLFALPASASYTYSATAFIGCSTNANRTITNAANWQAVGTYFAQQANAAGCGSNVYSLGGLVSETTTQFTVTIACTGSGSCSFNVNGTKSGSAPDPSTGTCPSAGTSAGGWSEDSQSATSPGLGTQYVCETWAASSTGYCMVELRYDMRVSLESYGKPGWWRYLGGDSHFLGNECVPGNGNGTTADAPLTASSSAASSGTSTAPRQGNCPPGQFKGSVNGVDVCIAPVPDNGVTTRSTSGTGTVTTSLPNGNTDTTGITKETTCTGSTCTTTTHSTTTTTTGTGTFSQTTSSVGTTDKGTFCQQNPRDANCTGGGGGGGTGDGVDSTFGGSCTQEFTCSGDAVMCAIAKADNQQKCALIDKVSTESQLYDSVKATGSTSGLTTSTTALSSSSFDSSNALGVSASCITDRSVTVWGTSVSLPFSQVCGTLGQLGSLLLAISYLSAFAIVARGVR